MAQKLITPMPRVEQSIIDKPIIKFLGDVRMTEQERIHMDAFSKDFVGLLSKVPERYLKWTPEKYVFEEAVEVTLLRVDKMVEKKQKQLPKKYTVKIKDSKELMKYLKENAPRKGKEDSFITLARRDMLAILKTNPQLPTISIERSYDTITRDYLIKF